jgi:hypothetical protein
MNPFENLPENLITPEAAKNKADHDAIEKRKQDYLASLMTRRAPQKAEEKEKPLSLADKQAKWAAAHSGKTAEQIQIENVQNMRRENGENVA